MNNQNIVLKGTELRKIVATGYFTEKLKGAGVLGDVAVIMIDGTLRAYATNQFIAAEATLDAATSGIGDQVYMFDSAFIEIAKDLTRTREVRDRMHTIVVNADDLTWKIPDIGLYGNLSHNPYPNTHKLFSEEQDVKPLLGLFDPRFLANISHVNATMGYHDKMWLIGEDAEGSGGKFPKLVALREDWRVLASGLSIKAGEENEWVGVKHSL